jgi:hypothetical protein
MVTNRVYKVLVTTGTAATTVAGVTAGKFAVLKKDGSPFTAGDTITQGDAFQVVVGAPDGTRVFSDLLSLKNVKKYEKTAFRARVEQVIDVTVGTPVAGQEYILTIIDLSDKEILQRRQNKRSYSSIATASSTATTVAADFAAQINADPAINVTASSSAADLTLTADAIETTANIVGEYQPQVFFDAELAVADPQNYLTKFGSVAYTTTVDFGSGNFDQIRTLEQRGQGYVGVTNRTKFPVEAGQYLSVAGTNYDVYIIEADRVYSSNSYTFGDVKSPVSLIIACTAGAGTALEALLTPLIASAPNEALSVVG